MSTNRLQVRGFSSSTQKIRWASFAMLCLAIVNRISIPVHRRTNPSTSRQTRDFVCFDRAGILRHNKWNVSH